MRAMKGLVIGLGALIVLSFILLFYGFITNIVGTEAERADPSGDPVAAAQPPTGPSFGTARLLLPAGCNVVDMRPDGARLYLRTGPAGLCERIIVVDTSTGAELGTILIAP